MTRISSSDARTLAIHGGAPVRVAPLPARQLFGVEEKRAAVALFDEAMERDVNVFAYGGSHEQSYCDAFVKMQGGGYADGVNSGTNAVYLALRALEPEPFSEVIVPAITDPGGMMPAALCNCIPVPADTEAGDYNIGAAQIERRITTHTSAIIVAHISGRPADMGPIMELAAAHDLPVIEDAAQAHGALYRGRPVGTWGDIAAFSTMLGKHHATLSQGGVVYTRHESLYWRARRYADRGKPFQIDGAAGNVTAGLNCNMDTLAAAVGRVQLEKLPAMIEQRRALAHRLARGCRDRLRHMRLVTERDGDAATYWFMLLQVDVDRLGGDKQALAAAVRGEGFSAEATYFPAPAHMTWMRDRRAFGASSALPWSHHPEGPIEDAASRWPTPNATAAAAQCMKLNFHEGWTQREVDELLMALEKVEAAFAM